MIRVLPAAQPLLPQFLRRIAVAVLVAATAVVPSSAQAHEAAGDAATTAPTATTATTTAAVPTDAGAVGATAASRAAAPRRIVEALDRGLVAVRTDDGWFLSWRLLAGENTDRVGFVVYRGGRRLTARPLTGATSFLDRRPGRGVYTVHRVKDGVVERRGATALVLGDGQLDIPLQPLANSYVHHAWPGDLDGDGRYEIVVSRVPLSEQAQQSSYLEAYSLDGAALWRVDLGPGSWMRGTGLAANDPAPGAVSGFGGVAGFRNDDGVTVYDLDSDGRAEVVVKTTPGVRFADGRVLAGPSPSAQFVTVLDGARGEERVSVPVPTDFLDQGTYGGQFGVGSFDGVHPSLVTKLVVRQGRVRGGFDAVITAWDFDGLTLHPRWTFRNQGQSQGSWFHQIRILDVDGDGRDEVADGSYVVDDDGTLRYRVAGAGHGDRFDIGDLDPNRPGLEGFAIQQTENGVVSAFPWYLYDAATGERLITGEHPSGPVDVARWDVARGLAADIDPAHPGSELWTSAAGPDLAGDGVRSISGERLSTTTPSINFRIWWDGDPGAELLDSTWVDKWDPATQTSHRLADPAGVVAGPRNAVPLYGDLLGDWREEYVAEMADRTALRLFTTTAPTTLRLPTPAQDPAYRQGWTVRGYLQAIYPSYAFGFDRTMVSPPPVVTTRSAAVRRARAGRVLARDDFRHGTGRWVAELERGGSVTADGGALDVDVPAGATVWWHRKLTGPYAVELDVTPVAEGGPNDRVSDLNVFWGASDPQHPEDLFATKRSGAFAEYDLLRTYYVGFGGNSNTTTRFRRYIGVSGDRPLLGDLTAPLLEPNRRYRLRLVVAGSTVQYWLDGQLLFTHHDPQPYTDGWFGLRTTGSHLRVNRFVVRGPAA